MRPVALLKRVFSRQKEAQLTRVLTPEAPQLALSDVETRMNMTGLFKDHTSPDRPPNGAQIIHSSPVLSTGWWSISAVVVLKHGCGTQIKTFL
jgi:hypothetical protein